MNLYLIGGPMGVGKTTIGKELSKKLNNAIYIEGDDGWIGIPFKLTEENKIKVLNNIVNMINNAIDKGYDNVILGWVMDHQYIIDNIISKINTNNVDVKRYSLLASEDTLKERLEADLKRGLRDEGVIQRSIERLSLYNSLNTIKIDTSNKAIDDIIDIILNK